MPNDKIKKAIHDNADKISRGYTHIKKGEMAPTTKEASEHIKNANKEFKEVVKTLDDIVEVLDEEK